MSSFSVKRGAVLDTMMGLLGVVALALRCANDLGVRIGRDFVHFGWTVERGAGLPVSAGVGGAGELSMPELSLGAGVQEARYEV